MYYPGHLYDQAMQVPMIMKLPKHEDKKGVVVETPTIHMDILTTLLAYAGVEHDQADEAPFTRLYFIAHDRRFGNPRRQSSL